jgi:hypothetical protein
MAPVGTCADFPSAPGAGSAARQRGRRVRPGWPISLCRVAVALLSLLPANAWATTISFDDLAAGFCVPSPQCAPPAGTILSDELLNLGVVFGQGGQSAGVAVIGGTQVNLGPSSYPNTIVGLNPAGEIPSNFTGSIFFGFFMPGGAAAVSNSVSFTLGDGGGDADSFEIRAYGLDGQMLSSFVRPTDSGQVARFAVEVPVDGIHRIEIERIAGTGTQFGYSLDDLSFELDGESSVQPVPEPSGWLLVLSGLGGCLALQRHGRRG